MLQVNIDIREVPARKPESVPLYRITMPFASLLEILRVAKDHPEIADRDTIAVTYEILDRIAPAENDYVTH